MNLRKLLWLPLLLALSCKPQANVVTDAQPADATDITITAHDAGAPDVNPVSPAWSVHFSPNGGCEDAIVNFIGTAGRPIRISAYGFTSQKIADALIAKKAVGVRAVLDRSDKTAKGSQAANLKAGGVDVRIDSKHAIMHDKIIVIDGTGVEFGSYNYTAAAEHANAENCFIDPDPMKAKVYGDNFEVHWAHSDPF